MRWLLALFIVTVHAEPIEVITTDRYPITGATNETVIYDLDAQYKLQAELSTHLPDTQAEAEIVAKAWFEGLNKDHFKARIMESFEAQRIALQYGINRFPAVVINKEVVIYGVTDVQQALRLYEKWSDQ